MEVGGVKFLNSDEVVEDFGRWLIYGPTGTGKTRLASTIAQTGPTLFIDLIGEKGVRSFRDAPYAHNVRIARPESITQMLDIFWWLDAGNHDFKAVVVDSVTSVQKMATRFFMGDSESTMKEVTVNTPPPAMRTWGQSLGVMTELATFWYGLADGNRKSPMHVVMTAQVKFKEDENGQTLVRIPDVQSGAVNITLATADYVLYTDVIENMDHFNDETASPVKYIVRFGQHTGYRTKGRVPFGRENKIPPILGRKNTVDLVSLSRALGIGGIPPKS